MTEQTAELETPEAAASAAADASLIAPHASAAPARPEGLSDAYWDDASGVKLEAYARLAELEAADAARREGVPESAEGYALEPDEPVIGADGQPVVFDADDPLAKAILPALHEAGLSQAAVSKILGAYARSEAEVAAADAKATAAFVAAEQTKLGANHSARTAALHGQVIAAIGAGPAEAIRQQMRSADAVIALETLVSKLQGPVIGAAPLTPPATRDIADRIYGTK
ncbi:hypothetical protein ACFPIF_15530 [Brevundimonas faecalis]|uniref:hypothetical protein n=1 Tax=Brevundimonas faecalis TaxID=947378 RepID=UPI00360FC180